MILPGKSNSLFGKRVDVFMHGVYATSFAAPIMPQSFISSNFTEYLVSRFTVFSTMDL